jgi:DHA2 family multidrug resistance protein-like MFS transporter
MLGTARLLGQTIGAALVALIFGLAGAAGTTIALAVASGIALVAAIVSCLRLVDSSAHARSVPMAPNAAPHKDD